MVKRRVSIFNKVTDKRYFSKRLIILLLIVIVSAIIFLLANSPPPKILSAFVYPEKVMPGQVMIVTVQAKDTLGIKSAVAIFDNEKMPDERSIPLITGTRRNGVYETRWIVHDTSAQKYYNTTIIFTDIFGKKTQQSIAWQDPTVTHKASEITAGTFGAGDYAFPNKLNVTGDFYVNSTSAKLFVNSTSGNVGIGTTNPSTALEVNGAVKTTTINLTGGQIAFPATQVPSANANTLDDYEEGTWTATFTASTGTITISAATGAYVRIGKQVTVTGLFTVTSVSSPTGTLTLTGLPFSCAGLNEAYAGVSIDANVLAATATTSIIGYVVPGTSTIMLSKFAAGAKAGLAGDVQAGSEFRISATYFIS